jgi:hypothetical protein
VNEAIRPVAIVASLRSALLVMRRSQCFFAACGNFNRCWISVPQSTLNRHALGLDPWRQAKHFRSLIRNVYREAWTVGRDSEIYAA